MNLIGNIKVNETDSKRIQYFFACLLSFKFIRDNIYIGLTLNQPSKKLIKKTVELLHENFNPFHINMVVVPKETFHYKYGLMVQLTDFGITKNEMYLNFEEDHFCVIEDADLLMDMVRTCEHYKTDVIRASYFPVETQSARFVKPINNPEADGVKIFYMDIPGFEKFNHSHSRYFIGTNSFFSAKFAKKLYEKQGVRPHDFEISKYDSNFSHICAIPQHEILRSIDNDNEFENSCLLKKPTDKFLECMQEAKKYMW